MLDELAASIRAAWRDREDLHGDPELTAYRLFHGYTEGCPGLAIDRYGDVAIMSSKGAEPGAFEIAAACLQELHPFSCVAAKQRGEEARALVGTLAREPDTIVEDGLRFQVEVWAPGNPGLYLDARPARRWLRKNAKGRRILNLFSFAGSLGVAAMDGGALSVTHVDTQKRALKRCEANHRLNGQRIDPRDLCRQDVVQHLRAPGTLRRRFGGVIVDPPPVKPGSRADARDLSVLGLAPLTSRLLQPGSWMLCFFHHDERSWDELEAAVIEASGPQLEVLWRSRSGADFVEPDEHRSLRLSAFQIG